MFLSSIGGFYMEFVRNMKIAFISPGARPLLIATFLSNIGDWIYFIGMSALLYNTAGPLAMTAFIIFRQCTFIVFAPFTGYISDYFPRKWLIILTDFSNGIIMFVLTFLAVQNNKSILVYMGLIFLVVVLGLINRSARLAVIPRLVEKESLLSLNALSNTIGTASLMIAPIIAGLTMKFGGINWTFLINGVSFMLSLLCNLALPQKLNEIQSEVKQISSNYKNKIKEFVEGFYFVFRDDRARSVTFFLIASHISVGATWVFIPELSKLLNQGDPGIGYLNSAVGFGSVLGTLVGAWIGSKRLGTSAVIGVVGLGLSVFICSIGSLYSLPILVLILVVYGSITFMGIFANIADAPLWTMVQQVTNDANAGRVYTAIDALTVGGMAIGSLIAGWMITSLSLASTLVLIAILVLLITGAFTPGIIRSSKSNQSLEKVSDSYGQ